MDDFMLRALVMGLAFSVLSGPLGSIMIWRRLSFFGDAIAHSALLGLALATFFNLPMGVMLVLFCGGLGIVLGMIPFKSRISLDSILAIFSHGSLAVGLVALALTHQNTSVLTDFLLGDILAIAWSDVILTSATALVLIALMMFYWRPLLTTFISEELAKSEGISTQALKMGFALALGLSIGLLLKTIGVLLMTALLIIPASTARYLADSPAQMMILASFLSLGAFILGLGASFYGDTPTAATIAVVALSGFVVVRLRAYLAK
jgi:zinc transport system permease protein